MSDGLGRSPSDEDRIAALKEEAIRRKTEYELACEFIISQAVSETVQEMSRNAKA